MSVVLYTLVGLAATTSFHCAVRREISPCTCRQRDLPGPSSEPEPAGAVGPAAVAVNDHAGDGGDNGGGGGHHGERIEVWCEKMKSFDEVMEALRGKFTPEQQIILRVVHSNLRDMSRYDFKELRMSITRLELNNDNLG